MTQAGFDSVNKFIDSFDRIGSLSSSAILAMLCFAMGYYLFRWKKMESEETLKRLEAWVDASKAEEHQTDALKMVAERVAMNAASITSLSSKVERLMTIVEERLPRR